VICNPDQGNALKKENVYLFIYLPEANLRSGNRLGFLDVVSIEVALEVEVGEVISIREAEELLEGSIRLDVMLVLEGVLLDILVDLTSHIGAGDEGSLGLAKESAELISDLGGDLKDGRTTLGTLFTLSLYATTALAGVLDLTVNTLLELLDLSHGAGDIFTNSGEARENSLHVLIKSGGRSLRGGIRGRSRSGSNNRGSRSRSGSSNLLGSLLGLGSNRSRSRGSYGGRSGGSRGILSLLGYALLGRSSRVGGSRVHYTSTGGRIHLK
jgi:hypothetical protein